MDPRDDQISEHANTGGNIKATRFNVLLAFIFPPRKLTLVPISEPLFTGISSKFMT